MKGHVVRQSVVEVSSIGLQVRLGSPAMLSAWGIARTGRHALTGAAAIGLMVFGVASSDHSGLDMSPTAAQEAVFIVHLAPDGSDTADGRTPATAVRTLERVEALLDAADPGIDVEVRIEQGTYTARTTYWDHYVPGHSIRFIPIDYQPGDGVDDIAGRPVFRGDGQTGCWFSARLAAGDPGGATNLEFRYLQIEHYSTCGLQFHGGITTNADGISVPASAGVNNNTVSGMVFREIGSKHVPASVGYGGLNTWNSSGNLIRNNHFLYNENTGADAVLIHGVYLAHHSSDNTVSNNRFNVVSGGPVRTRNDSNDNDVYDNTFIRAGVSAYYSEWFCDSACVEDNPGHGRECASHGNAFHENDTISGYDGQRLSWWALTPPGNDHAGGRGCDNEGQRRIRTWGNTAG